MINNIFKNLILFIILVLIQVLIINKLNFFGYIHPNIYLIFILMLPFDIAGWLLLLLSFFTGLTIDFFEGSLGLNAASTVFIGFIRPFVIKITGSKSEYEMVREPTVHSMGFQWFLTYSITIILAFQIIFNILETFSFVGFGHTIIRIILSTIVTLIFILLIQYLFYREKNKPVY